MTGWWQKQTRARKFLIVWNGINGPIIMGVLLYAALNEMIPMAWVWMILAATVISFPIIWKLTENKNN